MGKGYAGLFPLLADLARAPDLHAAACRDHPEAFDAAGAFVTLD